jgi:hypothetical protein
LGGQEEAQVLDNRIRGVVRHGQFLGNRFGPTTVIEGAEAASDTRDFRAGCVF